MADTPELQCPSCARVGPEEFCPSCPLTVLTQEIIDKANGIYRWNCPNCSQRNSWSDADRSEIRCESCPFVAPNEYVRDKLMNGGFPRTGATGEEIWVEFDCPTCEHFAVHRTPVPKHPEDSRFFQCDRCGRTHEVFPDLPWHQEDDDDEDDWDKDDDEEDSGLEESVPFYDLYDILYGKEDEDDDF